ncbi:MAG: hypothetical protein MPEBLZ_03503 [Candidatus Methanoperedens nitroreducens]|uniref:Uncharacterized protein n=1 Tax=Candidatus Methanoperedens nitratireducens TaxID=1392998 RepID=A0A0P7ZBM3_9EURY|nr:MAG: hypothetical protein F9K14_06740 [Candidatus Methanoperedens sp.]KPQ41977.1 MAG: hypothetical protein MPEBLZ_03503 [Candidatus Methanoperedens sp. BLZ1]MBZ0175053.1 hypothetical protein [Candidatus Methanoperedens nitroreducens]
MTTKKKLSDHIREHGTRMCIECRSHEIDTFHRIYITGELFSFPYCRQCGLVQWRIVPGYHLTLEKLYELYLKLADKFGLPKEKTLSGLEYIKKRKGEEGYSNDLEILEEIIGKSYVGQ